MISQPMFSPRPTGELESLVEAFESAWRSHGSARLDDFLPPADDPTYPNAVCELVRVDLDLHWSHGQPRSLDTYVHHFTVLVERPELLSQVAFEEYRQRVLADHPVTPDEYR